MMERSVSKKALFAWCSFDWANSAFPTVITTFVFAAYFTKGVAEDVASGTASWGYAMSISAVLVAVLSPVLGAIADHGGRRKPWLGTFTIICVLASAGLWHVQPNASYAMMALVLVVIANTAFETGMVFYNAMLPELAPPGKIGRLSGWGWGFGYFGGLSCLALVLVGFVQTDTPWFGLSTETAEHLRISGPVVALWFGLFCLPLFFLVPDRQKTGLSSGEAISRGIKSLIGTIKRARDYRVMLKFLFARMIYTDGLNTLFAFGGIYAVGTFGLSFEELILFGIAMNVTAGIGAFVFSWADDRFGPKLVIMVSVTGLSLLGLALVLVQTKEMFWVFGLPLGIFVGPAQSASRSLMARLAPAELRTEMFGLFALSGKATAFLGPAILGAITAATGSQRWGMATILVFFVVGLLLMRGVTDHKD